MKSHYQNIALESFRTFDNNNCSQKLIVSIDKNFMDSFRVRQVLIPKANALSLPRKYYKSKSVYR